MRTPSSFTPVRSYAFGFLFSIILTLLSFWLAPSLGSLAAPVIVLAAIVQLLVQLVFFLHIGQKREPPSNLGLLMFTGIVILILIGGTLWIMGNLERLHMHSGIPYENGQVTPQTEL